MQRMDPAVYDIGLRVGLGAVIGFCIGLTGVGGGVLVMPALTVIMGMAPTAAVGTATAFSSVSKVYAIYEHWRLDNIAWKVGLRILSAALPAAVLATLLITEKAENSGFQRIQGWLVTAAIASAAVLMLIRLFKQRPADEGEVIEDHDRRPWLGPLLGVGIGLLIATTSVGGGVIVMPMLVFAFPMTMRRVVGTAIFIAFFVSTVASALYHFSGDVSHVDLGTAGWLFLGSLLGIRSGTRLTERISDRALTIAAVVMILAAVTAMVGKMLVS